jgi:UDP-3-O-[3-hydroxymyristoyl] glucosamine N-acyltransferase
VSEWRAGAIAEHLGGRLEGDPERLIARLRGLEAAGADDLAVVLHPRHLRRSRSQAGTLVVAHGETTAASPGRDLPGVPAMMDQPADLPGVPARVDRPADLPATPAVADRAADRPGRLPTVASPAVIHVADAHLALVQLLHLFHPARRRGGVEAGAHVAPTACLAPGVFVAAGASVGAGARLSRGVEIHAGAAVGDDVEIGEDTVVFPNVTLYPGTRVGRRVRIHAGAVIGSDGFGYLPRADRSLLKVPQVGRVEIGDDVEIGANCTIDRATLEATRLGDGVKLDNLVHVGHNCAVGEHCMLVAQVGISGSVRIGAHSTLLGQAGVVDHVTIEPGSVIGAQAGVTRDVGPGEWFGSPAIPARAARHAYPLIGHLPEQRRQMAALERRCTKLEAALARLEAAPSQPDAVAVAAADAGEAAGTTTLHRR